MRVLDPGLLGRFSDRGLCKLSLVFNRGFGEISTNRKGRFKILALEHSNKNPLHNSTYVRLSY